MIFRDMNQSWMHPDGEVVAINGIGPCLQVVFVSELKVSTVVNGLKTTAVYVNEMGREVMRTEECEYFPERVVAAEPLSVSRWFRFKDAMLLTLEGLLEMAKCLKK